MAHLSPSVDRDRRPCQHFFDVYPATDYTFLADIKIIIHRPKFEFFPDRHFQLSKPVDTQPWWKM